MDKKHYIIILILGICAAALLTDCSSTGRGLYVKRGDKHFEKFDFGTASQLYHMALKKDENNAHAIARLADCCRLTNDPVNAEKWYGKLITMQNVDPINRFYYAQALMRNEKYDSAKIQLEEYALEVPNDPRSAEMLKGIEQFDELSAANPLYKIEPTNINSNAADFSPAFYKDGIIFTSNRELDIFPEKEDVWTGFTYNQLYFATIDSLSGFEGESAIKGKQPNRLYHDGPVTFNSNGTVMYLTRSNYVKRKVSKSKDDIVKLKLFKLTQSATTGKWENMTEAVPFNSDEYSVGHASLGPKDQTMYFMSDLPGGYGGTDIYVTKWTGSTWSQPENLGPKVNSPGKELFPYIAKDGKLYFASDGHMGLGGLDVYSAEMATDGSVIKINNLGVPLNSSADDFGFLLAKNGVDGYFSSNRAGGMGDDDIYRLIKDGILLEALVSDNKTRIPLTDVRLELIEIDTKVSEQLSDANGKGQFIAKPKKKHKIIAFKAGYLPREIDFETGSDDMTIEVPLVKGGPVELIVDVTDKTSKLPLAGAQVELLNLATAKMDTRTTNNKGRCTFMLDPLTDYEITGSIDANLTKRKYLPAAKMVSTKQQSLIVDGNIYVNLELLPVGVPIVIDKIYYDLDKAYIRPDAAIELDKLVKVMEDNPTMEIELSSHADSRASDLYNLDLTARRAISVVRYLESKGIKKSRMIAVGYGETKLVNDCSNGVPCSEKRHQENRRTEFKILKP